MSSRTTDQRIFVAGATGFVGTAVVYALLESGAYVTAMIPPDGTFRLNDSDHQRLRLIRGDVWNRGSLTGRSRGHSAVVHLVGSITQQPARGLTYRHLNVDAAQNVARMAIGDGVPHLLYLSAAYAPWLPIDYIRSKREAERYIQRGGIRWTIIRAPLTYPRSALRNPLLIMTSIIGAIPVIGFPLSRWAPLPVDILARGIAHLALDPASGGRIIYGRDLRQYGRRAASHAGRPSPQDQFRSRQYDEDDVPFGWLP